MKTKITISIGIAIFLILCVALSFCKKEFEDGKTELKNLEKDGLSLSGNPLLNGMLKVTIDIKPGSFPNSINLTSEGKLPVAIFSGPEFDASDVDPNTVTLGNGDGNDTPIAKNKKGKLMANLEDIDQDGDIDLILHFETQALVENGDLHHSTTHLILTGKTWQGDNLQGTDNVQIVGKNKDCLSPPSGMVGWWPGDGNADDIIGGHDGILVGGATFDVGMVGEAFSLDGIDDFVNIPHSEELNLGTEDFTLDFWVYFRSLVDEHVMVEKWIQKSRNSIGWSFTKTGWTILFVCPDIDHPNYPINIHIPSLSTGTWYHFAVTRSVDTYTLFWNGESIYSSTAPETYDLDSNSSLKFGHRGNPEDTPGSNDTRGFYLNGLIDEVGLYNCALSAEEIKDIFLAGDAGICKKGH